MALTGERQILQASAVCRKLLISALIAVSLLRSPAPANAAAPLQYGLDFQRRQPSLPHGGSSDPSSGNLSGVLGSGNMIGALGSSNLSGASGNSKLPDVPGSGNLPGVLGSSSLPIAPSPQGGLPSAGHLSSAAHSLGGGLMPPFPRLLNNPFSTAQTPAGVFAGAPSNALSSLPHQQANPEGIKRPLTLSSLDVKRAGVFSSVFGGAPLVNPQQQPTLPATAQALPNAVSVAGQAESSIAALAKEGRLPPVGRRSTRFGHHRNTRKPQDERQPIERPQKFSAWAGAQPNNVLVIALADTTLFQGICVGSGGRSDPRVPCGLAYPGASTFAVHLASGPSAPLASKASEEMEVPPLPAVLLTTAGSAGVEDAAGFADDLLYRAWVAKGSGGCSASPSAFEWGAGPTDFFTRSNATEEASLLSAKIEDVVARSLQLGSTDNLTKLMYMGNSRTSEFAALASLITSQRGQLCGAYLTIAAEATSKSRKSRKRSFKGRGEVVPEFIFSRGPLSTRALRLDFIITLAGSRFPDESTSAVPAELRSAVSNAIGIRLREVVDRYLSAAFEEKRLPSERRLSPEVPVFFIRVQQVRLVRDAYAGEGRVVSVDLGRLKGNPMDNLGTPVVFYTTAVGAAFQAYVLGHVKSAGLIDIVRQTILDARSTGPLHQPALAGHVAALREDVGRLHEWLVGLGPTQSITQSVGKLSALLLKSQIAAFDLQGTCNAAVTMLALPDGDPMLRFARQFCRVYPQTHFMQLAGSEELEAYSLQWGLVAYELLGGADVLVEEGDHFGSFSLAADDNTLEHSKRRRLASDDSEEAEDGTSPPFDDPIPPLEGFLGLEESPVVEEEQGDLGRESPASEVEGEAESIVSSDSPSGPPISEEPQDSGADAAAADANSERFLGRSAASGLAADSAHVQKALESEDRQGADAADAEGTPHVSAERLVIEKLQQELESQKLQQQLLLQHLATHQEQQRLIQRQQKELSDLRQQQQKPFFEQSQLTSTEEAKDQDLAKAASPKAPGEWFDSQPTRVTFAGINIVEEEHLMVRASVESKILEKSTHRANLDRRPEAIWKSLLERYGPLFLNFVSTLLSGNTLEDLIQVAEWHLDPRGNSRLCRQKRFSLFSYYRRQGRFSLMRRIMGHRKHVQEVATYMDEGDMQTWRRALEGLKRFQAFFD
ncbi:hypothetical protein Emag_003154 [Eimeria magna]